MYQSNYGYYPNNAGLRQTIAPQVPMAQPIAALKGHPVSSLEEARAMSIDFDGSVFFFPDLANKKIYTKQINADGTATLNMYGLEDLPQETPTGANYVTHEELEKAVEGLRQSLLRTGKDIVPQDKPAIKF